MELRVPIRKYHFTTETKNQFIYKFNSGYLLRYLITKHGNTWATFGMGTEPKLYFGITMEKHRGKMKVLPKKQRKAPNGMMMGPKFKREVIKKNHWKITVHVFPEELLKMSGVEIVQLARTFKITKINK